ncbi:GntR family transcriptional regulator [Streptomyces sp. NPDC059247]|uniref:GntR family transcriptional regulator n=1 Tax=Streptomyces sp. NPDC059247 TaxID=3346790 RepID=UPI00369A1784
MRTRTWVSTSLPYLTPQDGEGRSDAWAAEAAARGGVGSQRIVHAGEVPAPEAVAALLGVADGAPVVVRRRVIELDGHPCELTDTYYPADIARGTGLAETRKIRGGAVALLAALGHTGVRVREDVTARMPDADEREALRMGRDEPVINLARVTYDSRDRPVQADMMTMPAHRQRLRYETTIG